MNYSVYKHTFPNGKVYIGITKQNVEDRWKKGWGYYKQLPIYRAIQKYGWNNIKHDVLFNNLTKKEAEQKEIKLIAKHKSNNPQFGYNIANGGNTTGTHSKETKQKISEAQKGEKGYWYGKHHSKEAKQKMSEAQKGENNPNYGKKMSDEQKQKLSDAQKGEKSWFYGKHHSDESKNKIREANLYRFGKLVCCIETNKTYKSIRHAAKETGIHHQSISRVCNNKQNTAGGYHWKFIYNNNENGNLKKYVRCIETNTLFNSIREASNYTGVYYNGIRNVCRGEKETAGGYHWEYVEKE